MENYNSYDNSYNNDYNNDYSHHNNHENSEYKNEENYSEQSQDINSILGDDFQDYSENNSDEKTEDNASEDEQSQETEIDEISEDFVNIPKNLGTKELFSETDVFRIYNLIVMLESIPQESHSAFSIIYPKFNNRASVIKKAIALSGAEVSDVNKAKNNIDFISHVVEIVQDKDSKDPMGDIFSLISEISKMNEEKRREFTTMVRNINSFESDNKRVNADLRKVITKSSSEIDIIQGIKGLSEGTEFLEKMFKVHDIANLYKEAIS